MPPVHPVLRHLLLAAAAVALMAGFVLAWTPSMPARAQFDPTTTTERPAPTTIPTTTRPPTTTTAPPQPTTTAPPGETTSTTRRASTTSSSTAGVATTSAPADIPTGAVTPPVTQPPTAAPNPGSGSMAWWIVALSPIGFFATAGGLAYNWFKSRGVGS